MRLSRGLCAVVGETLVGSHATLDALFQSSGAPGDPPDLSHGAKWKEWLFRAGQDESVDSLSVLGNVLEEFMDVVPSDEEDRQVWENSRERVVKILEENGFRYFQGGRVLPNGTLPEETIISPANLQSTLKPDSIEDLLKILVNGLRRAMYPLEHRRKGSISLSFLSEYDIQDLLHALLRPWVLDIRPEEFTPSYASLSTRMDFLLPKYSLVIETKLVRDRAHGKKIGDELIIDIDHYRVHPDCSSLWCVIYDPNHYIENSGGLIGDLEGESKNKKGSVNSKVFVI
ncbi:MAG: transposase [Rhodobiaceae bacterium]|nr:transposase [Rhodobiaceae bacterium]